MSLPYTSLVLMLVLSLQTVCECACLVIFCWKPDIMYWVKGALVIMAVSNVMSEGKHSIILWLGLGLLVNFCLCPWTVNLTSDFQFFHSHLEMDGWGGTGVRYFLFTMSVRLSQNPCGTGTSKIVSLEGKPYQNKIFQCVSSSSSFPLCEATGAFFSNPHCKNLVELQEVKLKKCVLLPRIFNSQVCPHCTSSNSLIQFRFFYIGIGPHRGFCSQISVLVSYDSLSLQF